MSKAIDVYVVDRDKMLNKYSVKALIKFVEEYHDKGYLNDTFYNSFMQASDLVKEITLRKMIIHSNGVKREIKEKF